jgi:hypothetical protein
MSMTDLVGLAISLPDQCPNCLEHEAVIGPGVGPHQASIICICGRHRGWMSKPTFAFLAETIMRFGRPKAPIYVTRRRATTDASSLTETATAMTRKENAHGKH